jgi:pimeloyl-ACP methyl ester carboxylesterase
VLAGDQDAVTPAREGREIAELIPGARFEEFPGAGHMLMYERSDEVDKLIIEFARECLV